MTVLLPLIFPHVADVLVPTLRAILFFTFTVLLVNFDIIDLAFCAKAFGAPDALFQGIVRPTVDTDHAQLHPVPILLHLANIERTIKTISFAFSAHSDQWFLGGEE